MKSLQRHAATLIALAIVGVSLLVGCDSRSGALPAGDRAVKPVETMPPIRFFGDDFAEAYAALASAPVELQAASF